MTHSLRPSTVLPGGPQRRLLLGCLAVALGAACVFLVTAVPHDAPALGAAAALLGIGLLVAGTLSVGTSAGDRPA